MSDALFFGCWNESVHHLFKPDGRSAHRDVADRFGYAAGEYLRHELHGYTLISWWDRSQGDVRGNCNSTFLFKGSHSSDVMLAALSEHFPHVAANLKRAGVELREVHP